MSLPIPAASYFSYNAITWPSNVKSKVTEKAVTSGDNRVAKCSELTISVSGYLTQADADAMLTAAGVPVAPGATLDAKMLAIRRRLHVHGKTLRYVNRGYGKDLDINSGNALGVGGMPAVRDVMMGPKAGVFSWSSLGGAPDVCHGAIFDWTVTTWIPECSSFTIAPGVFIEVSFTINYDVGEDGLVNITYSGQAQIPMSLRADNTIERTVDDEIQRIIRPVPIGFLRKHSRQLSTDRTTCQFTIIDRQIEVPYPQDVVLIEMKQRVRQWKHLTTIWDVTLSGTVRMSPTANKWLAWTRFANIAGARMALIRREQIAPPAAQALGGRPATRDHQYLLLGQIEMEEDLFKNESRFTLPFRMFGCHLKDIVQRSGLWRPIVQPNPIQIAPATPPTPPSPPIPANPLSWQNVVQGALGPSVAGAGFGIGRNLNPPGQPGYAGTAGTPGTAAQSFRQAPWTAENNRDTLANNAQAFRGITGAKFNASDDIIIDVCNGPLTAGSNRSQNQPRVIAPGESEGMPNTLLTGIDSRTAATLEPDAFGFVHDDLVQAENSWVNWSCNVRRITDYRQIRQKPLAGTTATARPSVDPMGALAAILGDVRPPSAGWTATVPDIVQQISSPSMTLMLTGFAVRVGYRPNPPKLITYGGVTPVLAYEDVSENEVGISDSLALYRTDWTLVYIIPSVPSSLPMPAHPMMGTDGSATLQAPIRGQPIQLQAPILGGPATGLVARPPGGG